MAELPLLHAASIGDLDEVHRLVQAGHGIDERGEPITKDDLKNLRWLLNEAGVNDAAQAVGRPFDYTPLMAALGEGHFEVAQALLDAGADVNATDSLGRTPLMLAIGWKQVGLAERLIAAGANANAKDSCGAPVLTQAIESGLWGIANTLLDAGAKVKPRAKRDCLPISAAVYKSGDQAAEVVLRLLEGGATISDPKHISYVIASHNDKVVALVLDEFPALVGKVSGDELLRPAAKERKTSTLRMLTERGICPTNSQDESSPLVDLIIGPARSSVDFHEEKYINDEREISCMQILVDAGADVNHSGGNWEQPLHWAIQFYRSALCRWLLEHGADPNRHNDGKSPLDEAHRMLDEAMPKYELNEREKKDFQRLEAEARKVISLSMAVWARTIIAICPASELRDWWPFRGGLAVAEPRGRQA